MKTLTAGELLSVWERGAERPIAAKALLLLTVSCPEVSAGDLSKLTIGQRDRLLLLFRERMFGSKVVSVAECAGCGDCLEICFNVNEIIAQSHVRADQPPMLDCDGYRIAYRLPDSNDLMSITDCGDVNEGRNVLLSRCLTEIRRDGEDVRVDQLPATVIETISEHMVNSDPQANVELAMDCPSCGHSGSFLFDIASYMWKEMEGMVFRIMGEVHLLASVYGWSENEILSMSAWRRNLYINMINGR